MGEHEVGLVVRGAGAVGLGRLPLRPLGLAGRIRLVLGPGYVWGPAWVSWRWVNGYACWAPLGPRGYVYARGWPGWVVVPHAHFAHPIRRWIVPRAQVNVIVRSARPVRAFPTWQRGFNGHGGGWHRGHGRR